MNDEVKELVRETRKTICLKCRRIDLPCTVCPVQKLVDMCDDKIVNRTLISKQQFEYLCNIGVISHNSYSYNLVRYPDGMEDTLPLTGEMSKDLIKDTPWTIRFNTETHESPDLLLPWAIPEWLFMENQRNVLAEYFGRK